MKYVFRLAVVLLACAATAVRAQSLEIVELEHRTAEEVIPVLQPLLESGGSLSGKDYQLFIRTSKENLAQLRNAIAAIDKQPRQLLVSVRRGSREDVERDSAAVSGTVRTQDGGISVNEAPRARSGATVRATGSSSQRDGNSIASVRVLEGNAAFISTGESVPMVTAVAGHDRRGPWVAGSTTYRNLNSGFLATPRVAGDRVVIDIEQQSERRGDRGAIESQQLTTQVSARLGEWVQLGGVDESASLRERGIASGSYATRSDAVSVWVRVGVVDE